MDDRMKFMLEERMEPDYGLLDFLLKSGTLSKREIQDIKCVSPTYARNSKLLCYIEKKDAIDELKIALAEENQMHLVNFINNAGVYREDFDGDWPLSDSETRILDFNQGKLVDLIDPTELFGYLFSKKVINGRQRTILKSMTNEVQQNEMLIEIWGKTSRKNFLKIIECLEASGQMHIGNILRNGGAIFEVHVTMNGEEKHVDNSEDHIVKTIKHLLKGKTHIEQTRIMELVHLGDDDVQLISARKSGSIALYFYCSTLQGLEHLQQLMSRGLLKKIVEAAFYEVLRSCDAATFATMDEDAVNDFLKPTDNPEVFTIRWPNNDYNKCRIFLQEGSGLTERKESSSKLIVTPEQVYEMTKCCICTQTYNNPKSLPCLHTFCRSCLERCAENKSPGERIGCPVCRQQWKIPVNGVDGFPRNNLVDKLVEIGNNSGNVSKEVLCDVCEDNMEGADTDVPIAIKHCIECQQNMCKECAFHHSRYKLSRCHELISLEGLEESERAKITSSTCDKHPRKPMVVYCLNCQTTICQICFVQSHSGHKSDEVRNVATRMQKDLEGVANSMQNLAAEVEDVKTENPETAFLSRVSATEIEIRDRSEKVMMIVKQHRARLFEYLNIVKSRIQKEYGVEAYELETHLGEIGSLRKLIEDLKAQGSISDITGVGPSLLARAEELQKNHQVMCTKLKNQRNWPYTDLVPVDIDDLLTYNSGNLVGKIRVNASDSEDEYYDYYNKSSGSDDYGDDSYTDCAFQPTADPQPKKLAKSKVKIDSEPEIEEYEEPYEYTEGYTPLYSDTTEDSKVEHAPPIPIRAKTSPGSLQTLAGNTRGNEIRSSAINLERRVRKGKFTEIWLGKHNQFDDVAVKTFTDEAKKESWIVKSCDFFHEAEVLHELQHKNIVQLIGVSSISEPFYVITETTSKGYLDHYLKQDKGTTVKLKDIINMAAQITSAMYYLEVNNCIHRYLSAKSILVGDSNSIKLTNFEMARNLGKIRGQPTTFTDMYELLESPMKTRAPEVIESQRWSIKSDVWSFAIVLYEMLTYGAEPYPGMDTTELINCILNSYEVPCPAGKNFTHPEKKLQKILQCCWIKDPFKRPDFKYLFGFFRRYFATKDAENLMGYSRRPDLVTSIKGKGAVTGVAVYKDEIFLTRDNSTDIETYCGPNFKRGRCITICEKPKPSVLKVFKSRVSEHGEKVNGLQDVTCGEKAHIFTCERNDHRIYCIGLNTRQVIWSWQVEAGMPSGLSVRTDGNLLVSCANECKICEYTSKGDLVHEISFGCNGDGPRHALQIDSHLLVVCHGNTGAGLQESEGVSVIDMYGKISPGTKTMQLVNPSHLAVDFHQQILIAERARNRIILANHTLERHRILLTSENGLESPTRLHLIEAKGLLLVGLQSGVLMIYFIKSPESNVAAQPESASLATHENTGSSDEEYYMTGENYTLHGVSIQGDDCNIYEEID